MKLNCHRCDLAVELRCLCPDPDRNIKSALIPLKRAEPITPVKSILGSEINRHPNHGRIAGIYPIKPSIGIKRTTSNANSSPYSNNPNPHGQLGVNQMVSSRHDYCPPERSLFQLIPLANPELKAIAFVIKCHWHQRIRAQKSSLLPLVGSVEPLISLGPTEGFRSRRTEGSSAASLQPTFEVWE